jgi:hypothetical protein
LHCRDKNNNQQFEQEQQQTTRDGKEKGSPIFKLSLAI